MADANGIVPVDGALYAPTSIGHWKLVIGHSIWIIHGSGGELSVRGAEGRWAKHEEAGSWIA